MMLLVVLAVCLLPCAAVPRREDTSLAPQVEQHTQQQAQPQQETQLQELEREQQRRLAELQHEQLLQRQLLQRQLLQRRQTEDALRRPRPPANASDVIRAELAWSWNAYATHALGFDTLRPISQRGTNDFGGSALTLLDSLDVLLLMRLDGEFARACKGLASKDFAHDKFVSVFETTIRGLGGLLGAHALAVERDALLQKFHLAADARCRETLLARASELAHRLAPALTNASGGAKGFVAAAGARSQVLPTSDVNLLTGALSVPSGSSSLAEMATLGLEFRALARLDPAGREAARALDRTDAFLARAAAERGPLLPILLNPWTGRIESQVVSLGARGDSYYEYLLKEWLQDRSRTDKLRQFQEFASAVRARLLVPTEHPGLLFVCELELSGGGERQVRKMDHLVCFLPAVLALGAHYGALPSDYMDTAEAIAETCIKMYDLSPVGIAPEILKMTETGQLYVAPADSHNLLRPETVETLFTLYRLTRKERYRQVAWSIFEAFRKHARLPSGGYTSLRNVMLADWVPKERRFDTMPSYWLAETLKYIWLTFSDDDLPLDKWIFTTEAHPIRIVGGGEVTSPSLAVL